jgi:hypothetical protein
VTNAYSQHINKEDSAPDTCIVVGSIYGGLIFTFKEGKVNTVFIGAAAE